MNKATKAMNKAFKQIQAMNPGEQKKAIQAMASEAEKFDVELDSLLTGKRVTGVSGVENTYTGYTQQVTETYKKYCGEADFGNDQVRAVVDIRSAFISGEGVSINLGESVRESHKELFDKFTQKNRLGSTRASDISNTTEMSGYAVLSVIPDKKDELKIPLLGLIGTSRGKKYYEPEFVNPLFPYEIKAINRQVDKTRKEPIKIDNPIFIRTGGYGCWADTPTTKIGIVLTECENYDRALKDLRRLNHYCARITPTFKTANKSETTAVMKFLSETSWKIGDAFIGTADFSYEVPSKSAHEGLQTEMTSNLKTIAGGTSVPVHWFGWVDQLSNRATAQELFTLVDNGTKSERGAIEDGLREAYIKMQRAHIDSAGKLITEVTEDFQVKLPLMDLGKFESMVKAYSLLFSDDIISEGTYRNIVPGIDPVREKEQIEEEQGSEEEPVKKSDINLGDEGSDIIDPEEDK